MISCLSVIIGASAGPLRTSNIMSDWTGPRWKPWPRPPYGRIARSRCSASARHALARSVGNSRNLYLPRTDGRLRFHQLRSTSIKPRTVLHRAMYGRRPRGIGVFPRVVVFDIPRPRHERARAPARHAPWTKNSVIAHLQVFHGAGLFSSSSGMGPTEPPRRFPGSIFPHR